LPIFRFGEVFDAAQSAEAFLGPGDSVARGVAAPDVEQGE
jgi:hypothetical protein